MMVTGEGDKAWSGTSFPWRGHLKAAFPASGRRGGVLCLPCPPEPSRKWALAAKEAGTLYRVVLRYRSLTCLRQEVKSPSLWGKQLNR